MKKSLIVLLFMLLTLVSLSGVNSIYACDLSPEFCFEDGGGDGGGCTLVTEGTLTIYSDGSTNSSASSLTSGLTIIVGTHSFIHVENTGNTIMVLGVYYLLPGEEVTFGIYGNINDHLGVWYNLEAYKYEQSTAYDNSKGLSVTIDEDDVDIIDDYIDNNDTWSNSFNCSSFASELWNLVSTDDLDPYSSFWGYDTPKVLANNIEKSKCNIVLSKVIRLLNLIHQKGLGNQMKL